MRSVLLLLATSWAVPLPAAEIASTGADSVIAHPDSIKVPPPAWMNGLRSAVLPGWGQFSTGHPIRGTVAGILDIWLYADAAQRTWSSIPKLRRTTSALEAVVASQRNSVYKDSTVFAADTTNTDAKGNLIVNTLNSNRPGKDGKGENIGHPMQPYEVDWFMTMLEKAVPTMTPDERGETGGSSPAVRQESGDAGQPGFEVDIGHNGGIEQAGQEQRIAPAVRDAAFAGGCGHNLLGSKPGRELGAV